MPEICRFYGIVITMYFNDHQPAHFHARYGSHEAVIEIEGLRVIAGSLSTRALSLVREWAVARRGALAEDWERARVGVHLRAIEPLP